jgi:hypothetical protein
VAKKNETKNSINAKEKNIKNHEEEFEEMIIKNNISQELNGATSQL